MITFLYESYVKVVLLKIKNQSLHWNLLPFAVVNTVKAINAYKLISMGLHHLSFFCLYLHKKLLSVSFIVSVWKADLLCRMPESTSKIAMPREVKKRDILSYLYTCDRTKAYSKLILE